MARRWALVAWILFLPLLGCGRPGGVSNDPRIRSAIALLRSRTIIRLEVLYLPRNVLSRISVTPEQLANICSRRITIENFQGSDLRRDMIAALEHLDMMRASGLYAEPDCRWGCLFYSDSHARVLTMYFDGHGWKGLINGTPVARTGRFGKPRLVTLLENRCLSFWD